APVRRRPLRRRPRGSACSRSLLVVLGRVTLVRAPQGRSAFRSQIPCRRFRSGRDRLHILHMDCLKVNSPATVTESTYLVKYRIVTVSKPIEWIQFGHSPCIGCVGG